MSTPTVKNNQDKMPAKPGQSRRQRGGRKGKPPPKVTPAGKKLLKEIGQTPKLARRDVRFSPGSKLQLVPQSADPSLVVPSTLNTTGIQAFAIGWVSRAMQRGVQEKTSGSVPYGALNYLMYSFAQFASGGTQALTSMPYVLLAFARSLQQQRTYFGLGQASYQNTSSTFSPVASKIAIGSEAFGIYWTAGFVDVSPAKINGFPRLTLPSTAFDAELAQTQFQSLNQVLADTCQTKAMKLVAVSTTKTKWDHTCSAYAYITQQQGLGCSDTGSGGIHGLAQLETPIFHPMLSLLNCKGAYDINRAATWTIPVAGDACVLGGVVGTFMPMRHMSMKRLVKYHAIDFNEILEVVALWVQKLIQNAVDDQLGNLSSTLTPAKFTCQITLQELALLLRNILMGAFQETQPGVQGLYPYAPQTDTDSVFVPFTCGSGTCFRKVIDAQLPQALVENIRCFMASCTESEKGLDPEYFVPILGAYYGETLDESDFVYTYDGQQYPVFTPAASAGHLYEEKVKGKSEIKVGAETPFSLYDGSAGGYYYAINNPEQLQLLSATWNNWLNQGFALYSMPLKTFGAEKGLKVLNSISMTRHWYRLTSAEARLDLVPERFLNNRTRAIQASPYATKSVIEDSSAGQFFSTTYDEMISTWIIPTNRVLADNSTGQSTLLNRYKSIMHEPHSIAIAQGIKGQTLLSKHDTYANKMIKPRTAESNDWTAFFGEMEKHGRGGILSSLAATAIGLFAPEAGKVASQIADHLPF